MWDDRACCTAPYSRDGGVVVVGWYVSQVQPTVEMVGWVGGWYVSQVQPTVEMVGVGVGW